MRVTVAEASAGVACVKLGLRAGAWSVEEGESGPKPGAGEEPNLGWGFILKVMPCGVHHLRRLRGLRNALGGLWSAFKIEGGDGGTQNLGCNQH